MISLCYEEHFVCCFLEGRVAHNMVLSISAVKKRLRSFAEENEAAAKLTLDYCYPNAVISSPGEEKQRYIF